MSRNIIETVMGAVVLAVAILFFVFAYSTASVRTTNGYELTAEFTRIDGVSVGTEVRIAGVQVGSVVRQHLDPQSYWAVLTFSIDPSIELPDDTMAVIASESLLGGRYVALEPGGSDQMLAAGERITYTQSTPGIEQLLGQVIFSLQNLGEGEGGGSAGGGDGTSDGGAAGSTGGGLLDGN